tara:strand:- start:4588 stop:5568 length:981 start_codon:yes stop_codon:yes gene_type:complete
MIKKILITGCSGYIGSCLLNFLSPRKHIYGLDKKIPSKWIKIKKKNFYKCNLLDKKKLIRVIRKIDPDLIVHLAAKSTVNEKIKNIDYIKNNVSATKNLISTMKNLNITKIVYSSTAAVYRRKNKLLSENDKLFPINKYGKTKLKAEKIILNNKKIKSIILRFFNVSSALKKPLIGELHQPETHLIPVAVSKAMSRKKILINGNNYNTKDRTCIRDYIHIKDICRAINKSANYLFQNNSKSLILNVGNGKGLSNKEIIFQLQNVIKKEIFFEYTKRRKGDSDFLVCNIKKIKKKLKWKPLYSNIKNIIKDEVYWNTFLSKKKINRI